MCRVLTVPIHCENSDFSTYGKVGLKPRGSEGQVSDLQQGISTRVLLLEVAEQSEKGMQWV